MKQILFILCLLCVAQSQAQTVTIYRAGVALTTTYGSLKDAVNAAVANDSLVLSNSTFEEQDVTINKDLVLQGTRDATSGTKIVPLYYRPLDNQGFTIENPSGISGSPVTVTMRDMAINNYKIRREGGCAIYAYANTVLILKGNMAFNGNKCIPSATYIAGPGTINSAGTVIVTDSTRFAGNGSYKGSAIHSAAGLVVISGNAVFQGNYSDAVIYSTGKVIVSGNAAIRYNTGNGIYCTDSVIVSDNVAITDITGGHAIYAYGPVSLSGQVAIHNNEGGIYCKAPLSLSGNVSVKGNTGAVGGTITAAGPLNISGQVQIDSNRSWEGGAIWAGSSVSLSNKVRIRGNYASVRGGAISLYHGNLVLQDSVELSGNSVGRSIAGAIYNAGGTIQLYGGQIVGNHAADSSVSGLGMAIYNDSVAGKSWTSSISVTNTRVFNPSGDGSKQNEIYNTSPHLSFVSDSSWWGLGDTSNVFRNIPADSFQLRSWVIANWSVNGGAPLGTASSCPVTATFTLNDGSPIAPDLFWMLNGRFSASSGSFTPSVAGMMPTNIISTVYYAGLSTATVTMLGIVDADTLQEDHHVIGTSIGEPGLAAKYAVYPNPSNGFITLPASAPHTSAVTARVYDLGGRLVHAQTLSFKGHTAAMQLAAAGGLYILELADAAGSRQRLPLSIEQH